MPVKGSLLARKKIRLLVPTTVHKSEPDVMCLSELCMVLKYSIENTMPIENEGGTLLV